MVCYHRLDITNVHLESAGQGNNHIGGVLFIEHSNVRVNNLCV